MSEISFNFWFFLIFEWLTFLGIKSATAAADIKISILKKLNHKETYLRATAERNVLEILDGDCETAVGAHAVIQGDKIILEAELFSLDGSKRFYEKLSTKIENAKELGKEVGEKLKIKSNNNYKK